MHNESLAVGRDLLRQHRVATLHVKLFADPSLRVRYFLLFSLPPFTRENIQFHRETRRSRNKTPAPKEVADISPVCAINSALTLKLHTSLYRVSECFVPRWL